MESFRFGGGMMYGCCLIARSRDRGLPEDGECVEVWSAVDEGCSYKGFDEGDEAKIGHGCVGNGRIWQRWYWGWRLIVYGYWFEE
ncbi:hypothetical protein V6N13_082112 [Hibiscus sabdariffa]|uniref:Uncharacterized protein n=1 Tax=Hibiscus sabdariffa TaxID=183260 RepID=A0ABR2NJY7_9ROSI